MRVQSNGAPCERCGAVLAPTADAQQLARHRASRLCSTGPERARLGRLGFKVVPEEAARWLKAQGVVVCEADTSPMESVQGFTSVPLQTWVPAWAALLAEARADVTRLVVRAAVWRAVRFDALGEALLTLERLGGADAVRDYLLNDPATLRTAVDQAATLLALRGWTDA